jgi:hypothetical protein
MDGIKKAIVYSLHFDEEYLTHHNYIQLLKSIQTIRSFSDIDIVLFYSSKFDLSNENFFKENNVVLNRFNNDDVIIRWTETIPEHPWNKYLHHRWHNIVESFKQYDFDKILYLDTDTIFYKSPEELFNKYNKDIFYLKKEFDDGIVNSLTSSIDLYPAINDGQIIVSKNMIMPYLDNFINMLVNKINLLTHKIYNSLNSQTDHIFFWNVSQYAVYSLIKELKIQFEYFDEKDIALGIDFELKDKDLVYIHHYFSGNMRRYI